MLGVKFEDLTKDELVYLLRGNVWRLHGANLEGQLAMCRELKENQKQSDTLGKSMEATKAYLDWIKKYDGMKLGDIPDDEIHEGARLERAAKRANATADRMLKKKYG